MATKKPRPKLTCRACGKPEKRSMGGLYSNLSPYQQICVDCINKAFAPKRDGVFRRDRRLGGS